MGGGIRMVHTCKPMTVSFQCMTKSTTIIIIIIIKERGRWEGVSGWGTRVNPWLIHISVWQKPLQYRKEISLQLIKINGERKAVKSLT